MTAILSKIVLHLQTRVRDPLERGISGIQQQNHLDRWIGSRPVPHHPIDRPEGKDRTRFLVIEQREVFLFETRNRPAGIIGYHDIELDLAFRTTPRRCRTLGESWMTAIRW